MPKRYDNPQDIARLVAETRRLRLSAQRKPFTGMMTMFCYVLWKDYKYSQTKLSDFCKLMAKYDSEYEGLSFENLSKRLFDYADWTVEYKEFTVNDFPRYKSKVAMKYIEEQVLCNNEINEKSTRYITYGFNVLIDCGFGKKKLTNLKDKFQKRMEDVTKDERTEGIMDMWKELVDKAGIYIERPIIN